MLTKKDCEQATYRQNFYHQTLRDFRGNVVRCRVNGKCQTWKTRSTEFKIPVKYGLKQCFYIDHTNAHEWCLTEEDANLLPLKKRGDWNKFVEKTGQRPTTFNCSVCGGTHLIPSKKDTISTGYAVDENDNLVCFQCCAINDIKEMYKTGKITLYLSTKDNGEYKVSNWCQSLVFNVVFFKIGKHNWGLKRYDVWFKDNNGKIWHGRQYGDNTQICHCKMTKYRSYNDI